MMNLESYFMATSNLKPVKEHWKLDLIFLKIIRIKDLADSSINLIFLGRTFTLKGRA
jgi:hypothetical protein